MIKIFYVTKKIYMDVFVCILYVIYDNSINRTLIVTKSFILVNKIFKLQKKTNKKIDCFNDLKNTSILIDGFLNQFISPTILKNERTNPLIF